MLLPTNRESRLLQMSHWKLPVTLTVYCMCIPLNLFQLCPLTWLTVETVQSSKFMSHPTKTSLLSLGIQLSSIWYHWQHLLWSSTHTGPSVLSMLWSPFTVFKLIYRQFTWIKNRPQALIYIYLETLYPDGTCTLCKCILLINLSRFN